MHISNLSEQRVLIVPGLYGSEPAHWQSRWQRLYPSFERVDQDDAATPDLEVWTERFQQVLQRSARPTFVAAHSFGALTTINAVAQGAPNLIGALLVAPADPDKFGLAEVLRVRSLAAPSLVVGSLSDPWMTSERARMWAGIWGADFLSAGDLGHINAESGLGDWPFGLALLQKIVIEANSIFQNHIRT
jgi:predicted alpha/beta hydrolase family esterase